MKTVFITGADRGIGNAMCEQFLEHGWKVFAGQFMPRWGFLSKNLERYPNNLKLIPLDVSKDESVRAAAALVAQETDELLHKVFDGSVDKLFASLLGRRNLTAEQVEKLKEMVEELGEDGA